MIKRIKILSKTELNQYWTFINSAQFLERYKCSKMAFACIISSTNEPHPIPDCRSITLQFDDLIIETSWGITPSEDHARQIAQFINELHETPEEYLLVCQCDGGSSRSGAAGEYAVQVAGLDHKRFVRENPRVLPNTLMQKMFTEIILEDIADTPKELLDKILLHGDFIQLTGGTTA